jgi:hypothetical protein
MNIDVGLNAGFQGQGAQVERWRRVWARAGRGWRMRCADHRRCAEARLRLGFERVPPRVWARHGALLSTVRASAQGRDIL